MPVERLPVHLLPPAEGQEVEERVYDDVRARLFDHPPRETRQWIAGRFEAFLGEPANRA